MTSKSLLASGNWGERIYSRIRSLQDLADWGFMVIIWMIGYAIVYFYDVGIYSKLIIYIQNLPTATGLYGLLNLFGVLLGLMGILQLSQVDKLRKTLREWKKEYFKNNYVFNFEILPAIGRNEVEKILNHLNSVFPDLHYKRTPDNMIVDVEVRGLKSRHKFDVVIKEAEAEERTGSVIVGIKDKVSLQDFKNFISEVKDARRWEISRPIRILLIANRFSDSILRFVENNKNLQNLPIDLIKKEGNGYKVFYVTT